VIDDQGAFSFGPIKAASTSRLQGRVTARDLKLTRDGESDDLKITLLDSDGNPTADTLLVKGEFAAMVLNLQAFGNCSTRPTACLCGSNQIEKFLFDDGSAIDFGRFPAGHRQPGDRRRRRGLRVHQRQHARCGAGMTIERRAGADTYVFGRAMATTSSKTMTSRRNCSATPTPKDHVNDG